jgi:hypothetical protein
MRKSGIFSNLALATELDLSRHDCVWAKTLDDDVANAHRHTAIVDVYLIGGFQILTFFLITRNGEI